jgi:hypothetical protein
MDLTPLRHLQIRGDYHDEQRRINALLPPLFARAFALRGKHYKGCGFHYGIEKSLDGLLRWCNDFENSPPALEMLSACMAMTVIYEGVIEQLDAAEASLKG